MPDPFGITAGVVGVTVPALNATRRLLVDLQNIKDAPDTVQRLRDDVRSVDMALTSLGAVKDQDWEPLGASVAEEAKTTISIYTSACEQFSTDLQRWTRHSGNGKLAWQDRANVGFFKQGEIKAMSEQLQNCKVTINSVVSMATLYSSIRHTHITEETKRTISTKQFEIKSAVDAADGQLRALGNRVEELKLATYDQQVDESTMSHAEALRQLEEERKAITASRKLLAELLSKAQEAKAAADNQGRSISVTFGYNNSGFQAGTIDGGVSGISFGGK
ncbi:hypothetical protein BU23DRAFT_513492 [Bimuria novae-zelandiae CBS 107.79]|uniref:Azaphilone pigments biosynthesis cluster protein L N-terminal domain-containing protein n=1 Tax=Bimuria novae-zelandiae CBS 107.79 TaxID=1447943 RepID=A0A6A5UVZ0_9PLEO|nr:hypothetical protein BU23DRAFT_513492 [Bimuria novae-zelandiae CBS 107.79]